MKIRSITCFVPQVDAPTLDAAAGLNALARQAFEAAGYDVQSSRLATAPFADLLPAADERTYVDFACRLEQDAAACGFDYVSLGPALPEAPASYRAIPAILEATQNVFVSGAMTHGDRVSLPAVRACAEIVFRVASITPDGFANLRFCASANVPPGAPFFPAAYHAPGASCIALALAIQAADLAVLAFTTGGPEGAASLPSARQFLIDVLEEHARSLSAIAGKLASAAGASWGGIDFSLAPFPVDIESAGAALEALGVPALGLSGSLAAAATLADTLDRASFARAGFSGLMLPVLEDSRLAQRAAEGVLTLTDLLLYSAVCGTGLDTIPLPGDTTADELYAVLLDVAALAQRLDKPLTARLMPIPGKQAGDPTGYDFAFFANSRIMSLRAAPLRGFFAGEEDFSLIPHKTARLETHS
ncbi:MAG: DUF711 family protein [Chloroflexota bacterium]